MNHCPYGQFSTPRLTWQGGLYQLYRMDADREIIRAEKFLRQVIRLGTPMPPPRPLALIKLDREWGSTRGIDWSRSIVTIVDDTGVTFRWKDYRANGRERHKVMTLETDEFIHRYDHHRDLRARLRAARPSIGPDQDRHIMMRSRENDIRRLLARAADPRPATVMLAPMPDRRTANLSPPCSQAPPKRADARPLAPAWQPRVNDHKQGSDSGKAASKNKNIDVTLTATGSSARHIQVTRNQRVFLGFPVWLFTTLRAHDAARS